MPLGKRRRKSAAANSFSTRSSAFWQYNPSINALTRTVISKLHPMVGLREFLSALFEHGHVRAAAIAEEGKNASDEALNAVLEDCHRTTRMEFPGEPPEFLLPQARWAAEQFYRACQLCVFRDAGPEVVEAALSVRCPASPAAAQHYSVDLVFRFLPDLMRHATTASPSDPLVAHLRSWAVEWPLSSVGIPDVEDGADLGPIVEHPGLLRLYVDRIVARGDARRLTHQKVSSAVRAALGEYRQLAPALAAVLAAQHSE